MMRERKGHRKLRLCSRKHYERNKYFPKKLLMSIPRRAVCILKVSLPVNLLSFRVSLPISAFSESPVASLDILHHRIMLLGAVPQNWNCHIKDGVLSIYQLCLSDKGPVIMLSLTIKQNFSYVVRFQNQPVILQNVPSSINSVSRLIHLIGVVCAFKKTEEPQIQSP